MIVQSEKLRTRTRFADDVNVVTLNIQTRLRGQQHSEKKEQFFANGANLEA